MPRKAKEWNPKDLKPIIKDWLTRLRSGRYKQTTGELKGIRSEDEKVGYCCLGLLCQSLQKFGYGKWEGDTFIPVDTTSDPNEDTDTQTETQWVSEIGHLWQARLKMFTSEKIPGKARPVVADIHSAGINMNDLNGEVPNPDFNPGIDWDRDTMDADTPVPFELIADEAERFYKTTGVL